MPSEALLFFKGQEICCSDETLLGQAMASGEEEGNGNAQVLFACDFNLTQ